MTNLLKIILVFIIITSTHYRALGQPEWNDDPVDTPIDGGIGFLITAAIGIGTYTIKKEREKQQFK